MPVSGPSTVDFGVRILPGSFVLYEEFLGGYKM
jgi:hypothetical protein